MSKIQIKMPLEHANVLRKVLDRAALDYMPPADKDKIFDLLNDLRGFLGGGSYSTRGNIQIKGIDNE